MERAFHPDKGIWYVSLDGERWYPASEKPKLSNLEKMRAEVAAGKAEYVRRFWTLRRIEIEPVIAQTRGEDTRPMERMVDEDYGPHKNLGGISEETRRYFEELLGEP
jgi:hypothetical protein